MVSDDWARVLHAPTSHHSSATCERMDLARQRAGLRVRRFRRKFCAYRRLERDVVHPTTGRSIRRPRLGGNSTWSAPQRVTTSSWWAWAVWEVPQPIIWPPEDAGCSAWSDISPPMTRDPGSPRLIGRAGRCRVVMLPPAQMVRRTFRGRPWCLCGSGVPARYG